MADLEDVGGSAVSLGSKTSANSIPVVIASDQGAVAVSQSGTWTVGLSAGSNTVGKDDILGNGGATMAATIAQRTAPTNGIAIIGQFNTSLPTVSNTNTAAIQIDSSGRLLVGSIASALPAGGNTIGAVTQASGPWTNNVTQFGGNNVVTGTGAGGSGIPRVTVSNDSNVLATQSGTWTVQPGNTQNSTPWLVTGSGQTFPATQSGTWNVGLTTGTNSFGKISDVTNIETPVAPAAATAVNGVLVATQYNSNQPTFTNGQQGALQGSAHGAQYVATGVDPFTVSIAGAVTGAGSVGKPSGGVMTVQGAPFMTPIAASIVNPIPQVITNNIPTMPRLCGSYATVHITTSADTLLVAPNGGKADVYVCDFEFSAAAAQNFFFEKSASTACSSATQISILWTLAANEAKAAIDPYYRGFHTGPGQNLCVNTATASAAVDIGVYYDSN